MFRTFANPFGTIPRALRNSRAGVPILFNGHSRPRARVSRGCWTCGWRRRWSLPRPEPFGRTPGLHASRGSWLTASPWAARSVSRVQYLERQIRGCHRRRTVKHWLNNVGIGFDYIGANPEKYSQTHYRGSDCKTHVLAHLGNLQLGGMSIREKRV